MEISNCFVYIQTRESPLPPFAKGGKEILLLLKGEKFSKGGKQILASQWPEGDFNTNICRIQEYIKYKSGNIPRRFAPPRSTGDF